MKEKLYPKIFVDLILEIQLRKLGKFIILNEPDITRYKGEKIIIYSNHFYIYDVHILNRLRKTVFKDRKLMIWMQEYKRYPFFSKFALILDFKTKYDRAISILKTIRLLNSFPDKFYFFIFPEGKLHDEREGILKFNPRIYEFLGKIKPFYSVPVVFKVRKNEVIVNFGKIELNEFSRDKLVELLEML